MKMKYNYLVRICTILSIVLFAGFFAKGQSIENSNFKIPDNDPNYGIFSFVEARYHRGSHLANDGNLQDVLKNKYSAIDLKIGLQSDGSKLWQQLYGYPVYGVGFYTADLGNSDTLGEPSSVFLFFNAPIKRWKRFSIHYGLELGIAYDFNNYDPVTNPANDVIGSPVNVHLSVGFWGQYMISQRWDATLGFDFTHNSNGSTRTPNMGLNMYGPTVGLRYNFNPIKSYTKKIDPIYQPPLRPTFIVQDVPPSPKGNNLNLLLAGGWKTTNTTDSLGNYTSPVYGIATVAVDYMHQYCHIGRYGAGVDFFIDGSLVEEVDEGVVSNFGDIVQLGYHVGHELIIDQFTFITDLGFYAYNNGNKGNFWLRFNLRIDVNERFAIQGGLKTQNGGIADFIEWGIHYKLLQN